MPEIENPVGQLPGRRGRAGPAGCFPAPSIKNRPCRSGRSETGRGRSPTTRPCPASAYPDPGSPPGSGTLGNRRGLTAPTQPWITPLDRRRYPDRPGPTRPTDPAQTRLAPGSAPASFEAPLQRSARSRGRWRRGRTPRNGGLVAKLERGLRPGQISPPPGRPRPARSARSSPVQSGRPGLVPSARSGPVSPVPVRSAQSGPVSPVPVRSAQSGPVGPVPVRSAQSGPVGPVPVRSAQSGPVGPVPARSARSGPVSPVPVQSARSRSRQPSQVRPNQP